MEYSTEGATHSKFNGLQHNLVNVRRTYLPIDELTPPERLDHIISDSNVDLILAASSALDAELIFRAIKIIPLSLAEPDSAIRPSLGDATKEALWHKASAPAYLIYTSGTTGNPKGVEVSQRALINFLMSMQELLHIDQADRMFFLSSISFDISLLEILFPLCNGAELFIANNAGYGDPDILVEQVSEYGEGPP